MDSSDNAAEVFKIYKRPKDDNDDIVGLMQTECIESFVDCTSCQRIKDILLKYQNNNEMKMDDADGNVLNDIFNDTSSVVKLMDDYQHIIRQHAVDDNPIQFDLCYDYMVNANPAIICDVNQCEIVRRHFSRRRDDKQKGMDRGDYRLDILQQIHSYFIHSMDITKLNKNERTQIEEELKSIDDDDDYYVQREETRMKLVAEKKQQKIRQMESVMSGAKSTRFCSVDENTRISEQKKLNEVCSAFTAEILIRLKSFLFASVFEHQMPSIINRP